MYKKLDIMKFTTNTRGNLEMEFNSSIMELFVCNDDYAMIEWSSCYDATGIGLWFEGKRLIDYDGVCSLPIEALKLIRKAGFIAPDSEWM